jgi:hypothetical protein
MVGKSIFLSSGGDLKLSYSGRFFDLTEKDRDFIFSIVDTMDAYVRAEIDESQEGGETNDTGTDPRD